MDKTSNMRRVRTSPSLIFVVMVSVGQGCGTRPEESPSEEALLGTWVGHPEHNAQTSEFLLHFTPGDEGLDAALSIPAIDVRELRVGRATVEEDAVRIGSSRFRWDRANGVLQGTLPDGFVPVHEIAVTLTRAETAYPPAAVEIEAPQIDPAWVFETEGPVWAGPLHRDGTVYAGSDDGILYAIDAASGSLRWSFATGGAIRARPAADGATLYVASDDGYLHRLARRNGKALWRFRLDADPEERAVEAYDHFASSPVLADGGLYVGSATGRFYCLDPESGIERWHFDAEGAVRSTAAIEDGVAFFTSFDHHVYAVDAGSGVLRWKRDTGAPVVSSPAVHGNSIVVGSRSYDLFALNAASGEPSWNYYYWFSWVESSASIHAGVAYVGSSDSQRLNALDAQTGVLQWSFDTGGSAWARPAVTRDVVYIGAVGVADYIVDHRGGFFAVERATGEPLWQHTVTRPEGQSFWGFASSPTVSAEHVFVGRLDGSVYAFPLHEPGPGE